LHHSLEGIRHLPARRAGIPLVAAGALALAILALPPASSAQAIDDLTLITEHYPPYNFERDGRLQGVAVDLILAIFEKLGAKRGRDSIKQWPWARGYRQLLRKPSTVLFSTTRTPEREALFKWVGPISPTTIGLVARKDRGVVVRSPADMKRYRLGVVVDDVGELLLLRAGFTVGELDRVSGTDVTRISINKLNMGRIDAWSYERNVALWAIREAGYDPADYEMVHVLSEGHLYYAFHKDTPDALIARLQGALDELLRDGELERIRARYLR
jgi:ABC-type amino acid transport substrate-binding protein